MSLIYIWNAVRNNLIQNYFSAKMNLRVKKYKRANIASKACRKSFK